MTDEQKTKFLAYIKSSPIKRHYAFSGKRLWDKQIEVLKAVRDHKRVAVKSGNSVGKTFLAADVIQDYMIYYGPAAKVITTAPTWDQVEGLLWKEIRLGHSQALIPLGGEMLVAEWKFSDEWFAKGISTNETGRMQGWHSPHLLVVLDEASGVRPEIWDTVEALHPEKILAIGNPLEASGKFFECFQSDLWYKMTISCEECVAWQAANGAIPGLVTQEWINDQIYLYGVKSPWYEIHVKGEFPSAGPDSLIDREWVEKARKQKNDDEIEQDETKILAVDVATHHGENATVFCYRHGHTIKEIRSYYHIRMMDIANLINSDVMKNKIDRVVVDSDGVGQGLADILHEYNVSHLEFHGGTNQKAMDGKKFRNLRTQFYFVVAKKLEKGLYSMDRISQTEYETLKNQLCAIKVKAPDGLARQQIETKEEMMARGVKSPDSSDALMMSEFGVFMNMVSHVKPFPLGPL